MNCVTYITFVGVKDCLIYGLLPVHTVMPRGDEFRVHITSSINKNNQPTSPITSLSNQNQFLFLAVCPAVTPQKLTLYPTATSPWRRFKTSPVSFSPPPQPAHFRQSPIIFSPFTFPPTITSQFNIPFRLFRAQLVSPIQREALNE